MSTTTPLPQQPEHPQPPQQRQASLLQQRLLLLQQLDVTVERGLSSRDATERRHTHGVNQVDPPVKCPGWVCCLLPCIQSLPSQKHFLAMQPDDAEVKRNGQWIRYDASSLVRSDIIRLEEGDVVPADCTVLGSTEDEVQQQQQQLHQQQPVDLCLVDHGPVTGDTKPEAHPVELYWGGRVLVGSCIAVVTAVGNATRVGQLIRTGKFPVKPQPQQLLPPQQPQPQQANDISNSDEEEAGVALLLRKNSVGKENVMA